MSLSRILPAAAAVAVTLTATSAHASTYSRAGWVESHIQPWASVSKTMGGKDYAIGYDADAKFGAANWDVADDDSFTMPCLFVNICTELMMPSSSSYNIFTGKMTFGVPDTGKEARMKANLQVQATLMSKSMDLFKLKASARGASFDADTLSYSVWLVGVKVLGGSSDLPRTTRLTEHCAEIVEVDGTFSLAGIPVTAGMSAEGCLYVDASVTWTNSVLSGSITPGSNVDATLWAGVGISGYSAGVYGTVTIFDARLPFSLDNRVTATGGTVEGNVRATVTGLDGEFGLYLDLFGDRVATKELFDWTGINYANKTIATLPIASSP